MAKKKKYTDGMPDADSMKESPADQSFRIGFMLAQLRAERAQLEREKADVTNQISQAMQQILSAQATIADQAREKQMASEQAMAGMAQGMSQGMYPGAIGPEAQPNEGLPYPPEVPAQYGMGG